MDTYIISLDNPVNLINECSSVGLNPRLIRGIDGKKMSTKDYFIPKSAVAIGLSHVKSWKAFLQSSKAEALFLEDDAVFEPDFQDSFKMVIDSVPRNYDILYLGCFLCDKKYNSFTSIMNDYFGKNHEEIIVNDFVKIPQIALAAHAYVLSRKGALRLLELFDNNIYYHLDFIIFQEYKKNSLNIYSSRKRLIYQTSSSGKTTSLNTSSNHPMIIDYLCKDIELDRGLSLNFIKNISIFRTGSINYNIMSIVFLFLGFICARLDVRILFVIFFIISAYDLVALKNKEMILVHGILFILPSFLLSRQK